MCCVLEHVYLINVHVNVTGATILFVHVDTFGQLKVRQSTRIQRGFPDLAQSKDFTNREVQVTCER